MFHGLVAQITTYLRLKLWEGFKATWPLISTPGDVGQNGVSFSTNFKLVDTWGLPAIKYWTSPLTSGVTLTYAHHALRAGHRNALITWMLATIALGVIFLGFQITEYGHAYHDGLKLTNQGFMAQHSILLNWIPWFPCNCWCYYANGYSCYRIQKGHFNLENHFAFEGVAWYWHFVDVVWLGLFIFVYWI